jgi:hypothetical protein
MDRGERVLSDDHQRQSPTQVANYSAVHRQIDSFPTLVCTVSIDTLLNDSNAIGFADDSARDDPALDDPALDDPARR